MTRLMMKQSSTESAPPLDTAALRRLANERSDWLQNNVGAEVGGRPSPVAGGSTAAMERRVLGKLTSMEASMQAVHQRIERLEDVVLELPAKIPEVILSALRTSGIAPGQTCGSSSPESSSPSLARCCQPPQSVLERVSEQSAEGRKTEASFAECRESCDSRPSGCRLSEYRPSEARQSLVLPEEWPRSPFGGQSGGDPID